MYIAIFSHLTLLHENPRDENTSFKTSAGRCAALSADQEKVLSLLPKLSRGFKLYNAMADPGG